jgi:nucleoside-diphosphate-sugar epimerase
MILVTGGTGLIGSHLLHELCRQSRDVRALKRSTSNVKQTQKLFHYYSPNDSTLFDKIQWVDGDVEDYLSLLDALEGVEEVYHCAAMVSFAKRDIQRMLEVNVGGTANMVDASLETGVKRFCHVSSVASLGGPVDGKMVTEESIWGKSKGKSGYAVSKFRSEMEVWRGIELGLNATMVNPSVIIGPGRWDTGSGQIFGTLANGFPFYTKGITGYVDVRDVVDSMISAMDKQLWGRRFIINGENVSHQKVFELIAQANGHKPPTIEVKPWMTSVAWRGAWLVSQFTRKSPAITRDTANSGHSTTYYSSQRMIEDLGVKPRTIAEAVGNTVKAGPF